jgi:hypothetical protein
MAAVLVVRWPLKSYFGSIIVTHALLSFPFALLRYTSTPLLYFGHHPLFEIKITPTFNDQIETMYPLHVNNGYMLDRVHATDFMYNERAKSL